METEFKLFMDALRDDPDIAEEDISKNKDLAWRAFKREGYTDLSLLVTGIN